MTIIKGWSACEQQEEEPVREGKGDVGVGVAPRLPSCLCEHTSPSLLLSDDQLIDTGEKGTRRGSEEMEWEFNCRFPCLMRDKKISIADQHQATEKERESGTRGPREKTKRETSETWPRGIGSYVDIISDGK